MLNVEVLGQVFTPKNTVAEMLALRRNKGRVLEPSCGDGAFSGEISPEERVAIEYDPAVCPSYARNMDFFDLPLTERFETVIGNPPFVKFQSISDDTRRKLDMSLFDERSNLYLFFIHKCINHLDDGGELIFITPRDFLKATSAVRLNEFIYENGTITDIIDLGDAEIFPGFSPNCVIFRFEKGNFTRQTNVTRQFLHVNGMLLFTEKDYSVPLSEIFSVKVGAVSGADRLFEHANGNMEFVCSTTVDTGKTRRMFYNIDAPELAPHKEKLLERGIKRFDESNWFMWGRGYPDVSAPRIYVNAKTRRLAPFFLHDATAFDGSVLALMAKNPNINLAKCCSMLNQVDWDELGFVCDGRFMLSQRSLQNTLLPGTFKQFLPAKGKARR